MLIVVCLLPRNWMLPPTCGNWRGEKPHPTVKLLKSKTQTIKMEESWTYLADITKGWFPTVIPSGFKALVAITFTVFFLFLFLFFYFFIYLHIYLLVILILLLFLLLLFNFFFIFLLGIIFNDSNNKSLIYLYNKFSYCEPYFLRKLTN